VLAFERTVVNALMNPALNGDARTTIESYVDQTLRSMPEHLRAGVAAESILLGTVSGLAFARGNVDPARVRDRVEGWRTSRIDLVRQYVRLLESLVLFAEHELVPELV
jgi:hypothetical protein